LPIDFFEREVKKAQSRFNETFGVMNVCNIKTRQRTILTIIGMARLADKIRRERGKEVVTNEIKIFLQKKNYLNGIFNALEKHLKERRQHGTDNSRHQGHGAYGTGVC